MPGTPLFNPNDNVTGRDGGPYLDEVEARSAETRRAVVEGREPDFDHAGAPAGIPLVTAGRMAGVIGVNNLPSQSHGYDMSNADLVSKRADDDDTPGFVARDEIPAEFTEAVEEAEQEADEDTDEDEGTVVEQEDLNSHDPASAESDLSASDEDTDTSGPPDFDILGDDARYDDDASRQA